MRVRDCRHGPMAYLATDLLVGRALDTYGEWGETELELLGAMLGPGDVAIDVGANVGTHAVFFAKQVGPGGTVFAFEPQRVMHQLLCTNATLNGVKWLRAMFGAVGAAKGSLQVPPIDYATPGNFGDLHLGAYAEGEPVPVFALDSLQLEDCALIKIDAGGMEFAVLDGARQLISATQPAIFVAHPASAAAPAVIERLLEHDYACFWHFSPAFRPDNFGGAKADVFEGLIDANVLAVPRAHAAALEALEPVRSPGDTAIAAVERLRAQ